MACSIQRVIRAAVLALSFLLAASSVARAQGLPTTFAPGELPTAPATSRGVGPHDALWPRTSPEGALDHPILERGHDMGLISLGIVGLSLGMIVGVAMASFDVSQGNCHEFVSSPFSFSSRRVECGSAPFALIPFAGPVLVGSVAFNGFADGGAIAAGTLALAPQIAGLIFLLMGVHGFTEDLVSDPTGLSLRIDPWLSSSQLGASVSVSL